MNRLASAPASLRAVRRYRRGFGSLPGWKRHGATDKGRSPTKEGYVPSGAVVRIADCF